MEQQNKSTNSTPKLWNPNAAANWSLLFSPIFGAWLQGKNWKELNEWDEAKKSMMWVYFGFLFIIVSVYLPENYRFPLGFSFLIAWYFTSGKKQIKYFKEKGINYQKKSWGKPILISLICLTIYYAVFIISDYVPQRSPSIRIIDNKTEVLIIVFKNSRTFQYDPAKGRFRDFLKRWENATVDLVTQIVQGQSGSTAKCKAVSIKMYAQPN